MSIINGCLVEEKAEIEGLKIGKSKLNSAIAAITTTGFWAKVEKRRRETA